MDNIKILEVSRTFKFDPETNTDLDYQLVEYLGITIDKIDSLPIDQLEWFREKMHEGELEEISVAAEEMGL